MTIKFKFLLPCLLTLFSVTLFAQETEPSDHHEDHHEHHKNEIGIANSPVYFINEEVFAYGLHLHYVRHLPESKLGLGFGYERIFDEHKHNTFGLVAVYRPTEKLSFNLSPGFTFEDNSSKANFALHLESTYEFEINDFHVGPTFEFAYDAEDLHISLGLHIGYGF